MRQGEKAEGKERKRKRRKEKEEGSEHKTVKRDMGHIKICEIWKRESQELKK